MVEDKDENDDPMGYYYAAKESMSLDAPIDNKYNTDGNDRGTENQSSRKEEEPAAEQQPMTWKEKMWHIYEHEGLLIDVLIVVLLARIYPRLGADFLFPEVTAHWIAVIVIFFLSGFGLRVEEITLAASNRKFNSFVILYNFLGISLVVNIVSKFFYANEIVSYDLMKGMIICSCLSMPTNMMVVLSISSKGDEAAALFLATIMNLLGVFVTPLLIFIYLQEAAEIDFFNTYRTISLRVLLPIVLGIGFRKKIANADRFADEHTRTFLKIRERCLVFVVYVTFCKTFLEKMDSSRSQILIMAVSQVILLIAFMSIAWTMLFVFFNREPRLRVIGVFGCSMKTAALGIPLISAIYEDHPKLGIYTLPLLVWYPSQLIIGTILAPRFSKFVEYKLNKYERERQDENRSMDVEICGVIEEPDINTNVRKPHTQTEIVDVSKTSHS